MRRGEALDYIYLLVSLGKFLITSK
ncbi:hypothetical protein EMIT051CA3_70075 [Pseudomonas chlororaphis]